MSVNNIISPNNGKIFNDLLPDPYPYPAQANSLAQVLIAGNDAGSQDIVGVNNLQTAKVDNPLLGGSLTIGGAGQDLRIQGATLKGSILAGNGTSTVGLPVGANGLVLTTNSATTTGLEWAVGGGGGGVASVSAGNNISVSGTATNPIVAVASPLNATLNLGTQNITGTTGYANFTAGGTSEAQMSALLGFQSYDQITPTTQSTLYKTGLTTTNTTDSMSATPTGLSKTVGATALTLSSSTAPIQLTPNAGTNCAVSISGTGNFQVNQSSTGGPTQPATSVVNTNGGAQAVHLDLYKNSPSPATNDGIAGVSYHANNASGTKVEYARIQADQRDTTAGSENGSVSVYVAQNSATPTEYFRFNGLSGVNEMYKSIETRGNYIQNTIAGQNLVLYQTANATNIALNNTGSGGGITNNCSTGQFSVSSNNFSIVGANASSITSNNNITITANTSGTSVIIPQGISNQTKLITDIANVNYYPTFLVDNQNSNNVSIPAPSIQGQRLTIVNKGVSPASTWLNYGSPVANSGYGVYAVLSASSGQVWIARTDTNIVQIWDAGLTSVLGSVSLAGYAERAYCLYEEGGWMYIGGSFSAVNGNAIPQNCITRIGLYSYIEDPIYDGAGNIYGVNGGGMGDGVWCITSYSGLLYCGGQFQQFSNASPASNLFYISGYGSGGGSNYFTEAHGGTNAKVNALLNQNSYLFVGGDFTYVNWLSSALNYPYLATWNTSSWDFVGYNTLNGPVSSLNYTAYYPYIVVGGYFTAPYNYVCYIDYTFPNNYPVDTTLSLSYPVLFGCLYYNGYTYIHSQNQGVYSSNSFQVWTNLGTPYSGTPSYMGYFNGEVKVGFINYEYIQSKTNLSQNATFTLTSGSFKFNQTSYTSATITLVDVGWDFVGDLTSGAVWRQTSYNPWGSYS